MAEFLFRFRSARKEATDVPTAIAPSSCARFAGEEEVREALSSVGIA